MTTNPKNEVMPNPENTGRPVHYDNAESLDAAKKIENTQRQQNPANAQDESANLSQDIEAQIKRGIKPADIEG